MRLIAILMMLMMAVTVHECGHYRSMTAKGVEVKEFAVGMGPVLWQKRLPTGTMFQIRALPIGGFVKPAEGSMEQASNQATFEISMAGMAANAIVAFFLLFFAHMMGLKPPDFLVKRTPRLWRIIGRPPLWWAVAALVMSVGLWLAMPYLLVRLIAKSGLREFFRNVAGPIGILAGRPQESDGEAEESVEEPTLKDALLHTVAYLALLNAAIAGFNLLPLLPLDGGLAFVSVVSGVFGPAASGFLGWYASVSYAVFILLVASVFISDIVKLFRKKK